jgi:hypothetical protein
MNKKALIYGVIYALVVIAFKLYILFGGYSLTRYGFYFSSITSVFLILPFYILLIKSVRDTDYGGLIGGREAMRIALTVFAVSAVIICIYNYAEFEYSGKQLAIAYYNSEDFLKFLKTQPKVKPEDYSKIISEQIVNSENSAFKATTGKLVSMMLIGISGAVIIASIMKRNKVSYTEWKK